MIQIDFMTLFIGIPFIIIMFFFIMTLRNIVFHDISLPIRFVLLACSLIPIWGVVLCVGAFCKFYTDLKDGKILMRRNKINSFLYKEKNLF